MAKRKRKALSPVDKQVMVMANACQDYVHALQDLIMLLRDKKGDPPHPQELTARQFNAVERMIEAAGMATMVFLAADSTNTDNRVRGEAPVIGEVPLEGRPN